MRSINNAPPSDARFGKSPMRYVAQSRLGLKQYVLGSLFYRFISENFADQGPVRNGQ